MRFEDLGKKIYFFKKNFYIKKKKEKIKKLISF